ncbi:MAG: glycosyltransferase [Rugosibacter sp.]|nr:glycosyltransferase [Rugosibacter sp.]
MKFSILLPTRNGGKFLANCIESILDQQHDDFELVISDNANTDETPEVIAKYAGDPRLKIIRQTIPVPVSENWTAALQASCGDYILMMGDDDYLLPGTLQRLDEVLARHGNPDCILYNGYSYVTPNAIAGNPASYWAHEHFHYGPDFDKESVLERTHRLSIVRDAFRFSQRIPLNMQTTLFARRAIKQACDDAFKAPFPDHYLLNALLIAGGKWVYLPERLVVVGVSPKSFGHYFYSQNAEAGLAYLGISTHFPGALPGSELLNGMCAWLLDLKAHYPMQLKGIEINRGSYVRRQVYSWLLQRRYKGIDTMALVTRFTKLSAGDWASLLMTIADGESWQRLGRSLRFYRRSQAETLWHGLIPLQGVANIREFAEWLQQQPAHSR